jgi:hypothetical protein
MRDVDVINRRYENDFIHTYMYTGDSLHNASMIGNPESYADSSLSYLTKKLTAMHPLASTIPLLHTSLSPPLCLEMSVPRTIPTPIGAFSSYQCDRHTEASLNPLVQFSIEDQALIWASLGAGFPTIPLRLSEVCQDFTFNFASVFLEAIQGKLQGCLIGTTTIQHRTPGPVFMDSNLFTTACRGFNATGPIASLSVQVQWLRAMLRRNKITRLGLLEVAIFIFPAPQSMADDEPFYSTMNEALGMADTCSYRCGIMLSSLYQDTVAVSRWICVATRAIQLKPRQPPRFRPLHQDIISPSLECLDIGQDVLSNSMRS